MSRRMRVLNGASAVFGGGVMERLWHRHKFKFVFITIFMYFVTAIVLDVTTTDA